VKNICKAAVASAICGLFLSYLSVPAGAFIGAILGSAATQIALKFRMEVPRLAKRLLRICVGCLIGLSITAEGYYQAQGIFLPILVTVTGTFIISLTAAYVIIKVFRMNLTEAFLGTIPAGATEMSINAEELSGDPVVIATMHLFRLISIVGFIPFILLLCE
jgi:membrane AbrB-like protein